MAAKSNILCPGQDISHSISGPSTWLLYDLFLFHWECGPVLIFITKLINEKILRLFIYDF